MSSIDSDQVARFNDATTQWWSLSGEALWLHRYNAIRVGYISDAACRQFGRDPAASDCLTGLRILDIGCGGGVLCEPLAALGATVTGIDPAESAINAATLHAQHSGIAITYRATTAEALVHNNETFDIVLAMEVIEHVADHRAFLALCAALAQPGGLAILSTLNRTSKSFWQAIVFGEYILRLLPRGTHQWARFVTPQEMGVILADGGFTVSDVSGAKFDLCARRMRLSPDTAINYLLTAARPALQSQM